MIDTAPSYGDAEKMIGKNLKKILRSQLKSIHLFTAQLIKI